MAEINLNEDDELEEDLGPDEDNEPGETRKQRTGFFTKRRILLVGAIIGVVFVIGAVLFGLRLLGDRDSQNQFTAAQLAAGVPNPEAIVKPPEKEKPRKKIKYELLYSQLSGEQTAKILRELTLSGIRYDTDQAGSNYTLYVDETQLEQAKKVLALRGLPADPTRGFELLDDSQTLGVTEFDKRIRFLRALSGELEKAIIQFRGIEMAKVNIVLPEQRLFAVTQPPVTASILIRRRAGFVVDDEMVFGIIQLVANAVENLQPENVSVIDTEGNVLSAGVFERLRARQAQSETTVEVSVGPAPQFAKPIVPDFESLREWSDIKEEYEEELENKAIKQLLGILPLWSFKLAVNTDLGAIENGKVVDVRRLTASVVIDTSNEAVYLDQTLKQEIFNAVAGAVGYVRGRDTILLSKADYLRFTEREKQRFERIAGERNFFDWFKYVLFIGGLAGAMLMLSVGGIRKWKRKDPVPKILEDDQRMDETAFPNLQVNMIDEYGIDRIRNVATTQPDIIAEIMEEWLEDEKEDEHAALEASDEDLMEEELEEEPFNA